MRQRKFINHEKVTAEDDARRASLLAHIEAYCKETGQEAAVLLLLDKHLSCDSLAHFPNDSFYMTWVDHLTNVMLPAFHDMFLDHMKRLANVAAGGENYEAPLDDEDADKS